MAPEKKRPPHENLPEEGRSKHLTLEGEPKFSTHPPPHRETISGSFRLPSPEGEDKNQYLYGYFSRRQDFKEAILKPATGGVLLRDFELFERLPYCIRDSIQMPLLNFVKEKTIPYVNEEGQQRFELPHPFQIKEEIVRQVLSKDRITLVEEEVAKLLQHNHSDDRKKAEEIIKAVLLWSGYYDVQVFAMKSSINLSEKTAKLQGLLTRLRAMRVVRAAETTDHPSQPSESQPPPRKEEPDRS